MSVQSWLEDLRLGVYLPALLGAGYDTLAKCAELDASKLEQLGVTPPGHKTRLLLHKPCNASEPIYDNTTRGFAPIRPPSATMSTSANSDDSDYEVPPPPQPLSSPEAQVDNASKSSSDLQKEPTLPPKKLPRSPLSSVSSVSSQGSSWKPRPTPRTSLQKGRSVPTPPRPTPAPRIKKTQSVISNVGESPSLPDTPMAQDPFDSPAAAAVQKFFPTQPLNLSPQPGLPTVPDTSPSPETASAVLDTAPLTSHHQPGNSETTTAAASSQVQPEDNQQVFTDSNPSACGNLLPDDSLPHPLSPTTTCANVDGASEMTLSQVQSSASGPAIPELPLTPGQSGSSIGILTDCTYDVPPAQLPTAGDVPPASDALSLETQSLPPPSCSAFSEQAADHQFDCHSLGSVPSDCAMSAGCLEPLPALLQKHPNPLAQDSDEMATDISIPEVEEENRANELQELRRSQGLARSDPAGASTAAAHISRSSLETGAHGGEPESLLDGSPGQDLGPSYDAVWFMSTGQPQAVVPETTSSDEEAGLDEVYPVEQGLNIPRSRCPLPPEGPIYDDVASPEPQSESLYYVATDVVMADSPICESPTMPLEAAPTLPDVCRGTPGHNVDRHSVVSFHEPPPNYPPPPLPTNVRVPVHLPPSDTPPPLVPRKKHLQQPQASAARLSFSDLARREVSAPQKTHLNTFGQMHPLNNISEQPSRLSAENVYSCSPQSVTSLFSQDLLNASMDSMDDGGTNVRGESDDALSDGGDFFSGEGVRQSAVSTQAIPIVPATGSHQADRQGFLYKHASTRSQRLGWKKFWVTFDGQHVKYFSNNRSVVAKRWIPVSSLVNVEQQIKVGDAHPYRFKLTTVDRIYMFAASDSDDLTIWSSLLMRAILDAKTGTFIPGGEMRNPDIEGFVRFEGNKERYFVAIKKDKLSYYNSQNDYKADSPVHRIEMKLASVKELPRNRIQLTTPLHTYMLLFDTARELQDWKSATEEAIAQGLGDDTIKEEVYSNPANRLCADCGSQEPNWASVNLCVTLCKHCAGIHRMMTVPLHSKVRSLRMDRRVWTPSLLQIMNRIGNENANNFWEWNCSEEDQIDHDVETNQRQEYIFAKYVDGRFRKLHPLHSDLQGLNEALCKSVQYDDLLDTMQLLFSGSDLSYLSYTYGDPPKTALQLAENAGQTLQREFVQQNVAQQSSSTLTRDSLRGSQKLRLVTKKGYLLKTNQNLKEFHKRWFVLERGALTYYDNDKSSIAKETIERREMMSIARVQDDRQEFPFELSTTKNGGLVYYLAAESAAERTKWMNKIAQSFAPLPQTLMDQVCAMEYAGIVFLRLGATQDWQMTWMQLKGKKLSVFKKDECVFDDVDLRKITGLKYLQRTELCIESFDNGPPFVVDLHNLALYVQGDISRETTAWYNAIERACMETSSGLGKQQLTADDVPVIVEKCISFIATFGLKQEGIYRLSGQQSKVTQLLENFRQNALQVHVTLAEYRIHDVANVLKRYLRHLEEPLLTSDLYDKWIETASIRDVNSKLQWYEYLLGELPAVNCSTLKRLLIHLARIADYEHENKMNITNLAAIFGPVLLNNAIDESEVCSGFKNTGQEIGVIKDLLTHHRELFKVTSDENEHERRIQEALEKIEQAKQQNPSEASDLLLGVYVQNLDGPCVTLKVNRDMTAEDLLDYVVGKTQLDTSRRYALYEVILEGQLERPLHYTESVLNVTFRWVNWPQDFSKHNYLCVKDDYIHENVENVFDPQRSLFGELKFSEKKGFKKFGFDFTQFRLSYYKDVARVPVSSWNVEDLTIYLNTEHKRQAPTKWAITFLVKDEKVTKSRDTPFFGRSLCFNSNEELYRWLAAMMHAQYPNGLTPHGSPSHITCAMEPMPTSSPELPNVQAPRASKSSFFQRLRKK